MNSQQPNVGKYYDLLLSLPNDGRFDSNFIGGIEPFFPSEDEKAIIQELRERTFTNHRQGLDNDLSISLDRNKMLEEYLSRDFPYHFERQYGESVPSPISVTLGNEDDRMRIIDDLSEDLGHWDFIQYLNQLNEKYQESGPVTEKLEWIANPSALAFILSELESKGYIQAPKKLSGDTNNTQFAKQVLNSFSGNVGSLDNMRQCLGSDNEKALGKSSQERFAIPDVREISN